jgi:hypothetical protein
MALTDIIFYEVVAEANRGDTGEVQNSTADTSTLYVTIPAVGDVESGVVYGRQDSETGTLVGGGGGGPTYYAYG